MQITQQNQDVQGDLFEYLLSKLNTAGRNGQFRTPRHIIRMMVKMVDPQPHDRIGDLAAGTAGFLVNAYQHILEQNTSPAILAYDDEGMPHNLVGDLLTDEQMAYLQNDAFHGYDNDSGMTMLRIGAMNLMLHGIRSPKYDYADTLSQSFAQANEYTLLRSLRRDCAGRRAFRLQQRTQRDPEEDHREQSPRRRREYAWWCLQTIRGCIHGGASLHQGGADGR
jgi:type I restriction enzyme M protein